jgi:DNA-binding NarL/FixJ family response regulator
MCPARILVADDHEVVRQGLRSLIKEHPEWELVGEATDGHEAVAKAHSLNPDLAIVDISMPLLNGLDATKQIRTVNPRTKVLILTMHDSEQAIEHALRAGAQGYVLKDDSGSDMARAVRALLNGQTFFTSKAARIILDGFTGKRPLAAEQGSQALSPAQKDILQLLAEGKIVRKVAAQLDVSVKAVQRERADLMRKFNCRSVGELVLYAVRNHLLQA